MRLAEFSPDAFTTVSPWGAVCCALCGKAIGIGETVVSERLSGGAAMVLHPACATDLGRSLLAACRVRSGSSWERFQCPKGGKGTEYATIDKAGHLLFPRWAAALAEIRYGDHVEAFYDPEGHRIGLRRVPHETHYSLRVNSTGRMVEAGEWPQGANPVVAVRTLLTTHHIVIPGRLRAKIGWDAEHTMLTFQFLDVIDRTIPSHVAIVPDEFGAGNLNVPASTPQGETGEANRA